ncbi:MAG: FG-GAP-like repeat-containing protein [Polyangiales bacterium]
MRRITIALALSLAACDASDGASPTADVPAASDRAAPDDEDGSADVADVADAPADAAEDVAAPDALADASPPEASSDVVAHDALDAVASPDVAPDATAPDAAPPDIAPPDAPPRDVPALDAPSPDVAPAPDRLDASPDAPAPDRPAADASPDAPAPDVPAIALCSIPLLPMNGARVTSRRPTLQLARAPGLRETRVELCRDRACAAPVASVVTTDDFFVPTSDLAPGVWFWRLTPRNAEGLTCTTATWAFVVPSRSLTPSRSWGTLLDVNGDGRGDLAVATLTGEVQVFHGTATGLATTAAITLTGLPVTAGSYTAPPVPAAAGDLDGDGFVDLAVGLPAAVDGAGEVRVYRGSVRGIAAAASVTLRAPDGRFGHFGASLAAVGDIEGDGYADLVVGAPRALATSAADPTGVPGRVYAFHGAMDGVRATPTTTVTGPGGADGYFGASVAPAGDVNSDRFPDLVVGAPGARRAYVFRGTALGLATTPLATFADAAVARYGELVGCAGDVDADDHADVFVAGDDTAGRVDLRRAGADGAFAAAPTALAMAGVRFGRSVAAADVNADGYADLLVAAPDSGFGPPRLLVYVGGAAGLATSPAFTLGAPGGVAGFADSVASVGDVNGDGASDFATGGAGGMVFLTGAAMGAPAARLTFLAAGRVASVAGSVGGL